MRKISFLGFFRVAAIFFGMLVACKSNSAFSQLLETGKSGVWTTFEIRRPNSPNACGLETEDGLRNVQFGYFENHESFTIGLFNSSWSFINDTQVTVSIRLGRERWEFSGLARSSALVLTFDYAGSESFWRAFRFANEGSIDFLTGGQRSWRINLTGSDAAALRFLNCISRFSSKTRPPIPPRTDETPGGEGVVPKAPLRQGNTKSPF